MDGRGNGVRLREAISEKIAVHEYSGVAGALQIVARHWRHLSVCLSFLVLEFGRR